MGKETKCARQDLRDKQSTKADGKPWLKVITILNREVKEEGDA